MVVISLQAHIKNTKTSVMGFFLNSIIVLVVACWILMLAGQYIVSYVLTPQPIVEYETMLHDVKGVDLAEAEMQHILEYLRDPKGFSAAGFVFKKCILLVGQPGTGKTMLGRAIAREAGVPFFSTSGSEFDVPTFLIRNWGVFKVNFLFKAARQQSPCIIFIDEIDAIPGSLIRDDTPLFQLKAQLRELTQNDGIVVIGVTNSIELLKGDLLSFFDLHIYFMNPDFEGRKEILESHMSKVVGSYGLNLTTIARATSGYSGADLANLVNTAALKAAGAGAAKVSLAHLEYARDKVKFGTEQKSVKFEGLRKLQAVHESGHVLVATYIDEALPLHKVTIMPGGPFRGRMAQLSTQKQMVAELAVLMGGRVAEELIFGEDEITTVAQVDIREATSYAIDMVTSYGMSMVIGPTYHNYDGTDMMSNDVRFLVEKEVKRLVEMAYRNAEMILKKHVKGLNALTNGLLERDTLSGSEIIYLINES